MRIRNPFERLSDWQENYIECPSRACVILKVGLKLHQRIQGVYYSNAESELWYSSRFWRKWDKVRICKNKNADYFDTNKEINSSIAAKLLKVEIKKSEKDKRWK